MLNIVRHLKSNNPFCKLIYKGVKKSNKNHNKTGQILVPKRSYSAKNKLSSKK